MDFHPALSDLDVSNQLAVSNTIGTNMNVFEEILSNVSEIIVTNLSSTNEAETNTGESDGE